MSNCGRGKISVKTNKGRRRNAGIKQREKECSCNRRKEEKSDNKEWGEKGKAQEKDPRESPAKKNNKHKRAETTFGCGLVLGRIQRGGKEKM